MKQSIKKRTMFYRRAIWLKDEHRTLEGLLVEAHKSLENTKDRTFSYGDGEIQGLSIGSSSHGLSCHVAYYIPEQPTSLVPVPSDDKLIDTIQQNPPRGKNFMEGDIFFVIKGNHVVLCPSDVRESVALTYITSVLEKVGRGDCLDFSIDSVSDANKVTLITKEGVKSISLSSTLYEASARYIDRKVALKHGFLHAVSEYWSTLLDDDEDKELKEVGNKENISVTLDISYDARTKDGRVGKKRLFKTAEMLMKDADGNGVEIITGKGKRITVDEIRLSKKVSIRADGKSVAKEPTFEALYKYLQELKNEGAWHQ